MVTAVLLFAADPRYERAQEFIDPERKKVRNLAAALVQP
jgi:hypothetical protein